MSSPAPASVNLGFLTILHEQAGYVGGYLVTNAWGRPLEFRLSSAVQPNKVQQILYGPTLEPYICSDLIGAKLIEKALTSVQYVFTDHPSALDLRLQLNYPVALFEKEVRLADEESPGIAVNERIRCHDRFPEDVAPLTELLTKLGNGIDLADPFLRIREALAEARKLGVARAA